MKKTSKARKTISKVIGGVQIALGGLASISAYFLYASPLVQEVLSVTSEEVYLYMFLFLTFGLFSISSGLVLLKTEYSDDRTWEKQLSKEN